MPRPAKPTRAPVHKRRSKPPARTGPLDQAAVVDMAVRVVEDDGIDQLSLVRVAQRLGVTQPALYRHVGSFDELLRLLALEGRRQLLDAITGAAIGRSGDEALRAVATAWRRFVIQHPDLYAATDRSTLAGDADNEAAAAAIVRVLARVLAGFGLRDDAAEQAAWALRSALHGFVALEADSGYPSTLDVDDTFERFVTLISTGARNWDRTGA